MIGGDGADVHWDLIRTALFSVADWSVFPVQDVLGYGSDCRMNTPGIAEGNWTWQLENGQLTDDALMRLRRLTELSGRAPTG